MGPIGPIGSMRFFGRGDDHHLTPHPVGSAPMRKCLPFLLFAMMLKVAEAAQPPEAPTPRPGSEPAKPGALRTEPAPPGAKGGTAVPAEPPRMTKLKQLNFDRRPSAV